MADPLSVALAVVTLSTALKDIIEVARKLNDSFKKPRQNVKAAQALAADTFQVVQLLQRFYEGHRKILDESKEMQTAVVKLWEEMKSVYEKCKPILRSVGESRLQKMKEVLHSWKDGKELEIHIRDLRDEANRCHSQFMMFTMMRLEVIAVQTKGAVAEGFTNIHRQISAMHVRDESIISFVGSKHTILSTLPPHIRLAEDLVFKSYLRLQVVKIDSALKSLSPNNLYVAAEPDFTHTFMHTTPVQLGFAIIPHTQVVAEELQEDVVSITAIVLKHLKNRHGRPSIQQGVWYMRSLSAGLVLLEMLQEAAMIDSWTVNIYRALAATSPEGYETHLVEALYNLSVHLVDVDDLDNARKMITECLDLSRRIEASAQLGQPPTMASPQIQTAKALSLSSLVFQLLGDARSALRDAEESVEMFSSQLDDKIRGCNDDSSHFAANSPFSVVYMSPEDTLTHYYADALRQRYSSLLLAGRTEEAVQGGIMVLNSFKTLADNYTDIDIYSRVAYLALSLCNKRFVGVVSAAAALSYAQDSVHYYQEIFEITGVPPEDFYVALTTNAEILSESGRWDEAYEVCQKIASMIDNIDNQRLRVHFLQLLARNLFHSRHHEEAAMTGLKLLTTYRSLLSQSEVAIAYNYASASFIWTGNYRKAVEIGEASVTYCRALALKGKQYTRYVADSLLQLSRGLFYDENYDQALDTAHESVKLYSAMIVEDPHVLQQYTSALRLNQEICLKVNTQSKSLERSQEAVECFRRVILYFPSQRNRLEFIGLILNHVCLLEKYDRLSDGSIAIQEALGIFEEHPAEDPSSTELHVDCLRLSGRLFHNQGYPQKAPSLFEKAVSISELFISHRSVGCRILWSKADCCYALYATGSPIAITNIEECLKFAREHGLETEPLYSRCLDIASHIYRSIGRADEALAFIQQSVFHDRAHGFVPTSWALPELLADAGREIEALDAANNAVDALKQFATKPAREVLWYTRERQYSLALCLFATGELSLAQQLLAEVRTFYEQLAPTRHIVFLNLAIVFRAEGILACVANRHQEGVVARKELNDLRERLRLIFPNLADLVEVALNRERKFGLWRNLLDKFTLTCGHQQEL